MSELDDWVSEVCAALEIPADAVDVTLLLDVARDAAATAQRLALTRGETG